jgi:2-alkenal reductase
MRGNVRPGGLAVIAVVCALLGSAIALAVAKTTGWFGTGQTDTVVLTQAAPSPAANRVDPNPNGKPLAGNDFDPARIYRERATGVVTIVALFGEHAQNGSGAAAQGSGFVVSRKGYILTNSHVITTAGDAQNSAQPAHDVYVEFKNHDRVPARIVGWDVYDDVGLIKVDPKSHPLAPVPLGDSAQVRVGEPVAAIGSPFGNENSLAVGVVSATHRSISSLTSRYNLVDAIQTDAPINHGNSGGPLFDARGRVIGINAQIRSDSGNAEGVGFAVPIDSARRSMTQLIATGRVAYAYVGVTAEDLTPTLARRFGYSVRYGAAIASVRPGTAADRAGLHPGNHEADVNGSTFTSGGDVVVSIAGLPVRNADDLVRAVTERLRPGQRAVFVVVRDGRRLRVPLTLDERPQNPDTGQ